MLIGLWIRDVVLIEALDLSIGPGLTALTGETGAGKSIILDSLGLAVGARADAGLVRQGASQAAVSAVFAPAPDHLVWDVLEEKGISYDRSEDLVLRRTLSADGRSRAFVNDQATSATVLRELGEILLEVHGQHETVGLLDARKHRPLLDAYGSLGALTAGVSRAWADWRAARNRADELREIVARSAAESEELTLRLAELDRLDPREGEEPALAEERAILGASEKALSDISEARQAFEGLGPRLAQAVRAIEHARSRAVAAGAAEDSPAVARLTLASSAIDRVFSEAQEAEAAVDVAAEAFDFRPDQLEKTEERLFELRGVARKLQVSVEELPILRVRFAERLQAMESSEDDLKAADAAVAAARADYLAQAVKLTEARRAAGERLAAAVMGELGPLKLDKARFRVAVDALGEDKAGPTGLDRVAFEVATNPGAPFGDLGAIASGGELARFALALKASLAGRAEGAQPLMIFDEVDQGVGGAVADAVGLRLKRLATDAQVLVVTHSPQVAARAEAHWRISKAGDAERIRTAVETLSLAEREEEIARMLAGAQITDAARAAARALMHA
ncbi:DNA repair protein RecN [Phenylobacterium sp. Root77]|uniref:DNA repair protein RecN n=1 Tax=unclassified Phenylobacterium TaxID=2640670 RepID=UPI0006FC4F42|nr:MULTISPECIES: DNA repair protein RecN [unclassified Phenylobacterium]KQW72176.1 DNA repair protein RecN [Phenylobacterium sp. Root1277]KQW95096.1 DNA repair protein RecN [Phenylobacterium sp. Root1290]KRC44789.1 DNA repair protein RecN [Phenylobacterium sp. Root77]